MRRVTVVGEPWARPGTRFFNEAPCEVAPRCPIARACQTLPWGRVFEVVATRGVHHDVCRVHEAGVRVVEVEERPWHASVDASRARGSSVHWSPPVCHIRACPNWDRCFAPGLVAGHEYRLERVEEPLVCPMGYRLVGVALRPPSASSPVGSV